jgi:hypothetical protein
MTFIIQKSVHSFFDVHHHMETGEVSYRKVCLHIIKGVRYCDYLHKIKQQIR